MRTVTTYRHSAIGGLWLGFFYAWHCLMLFVTVYVLVEAKGPIELALARHIVTLLPVWAAGAIVFGSLAFFSRESVSTVESAEAPAPVPLRDPMREPRL